MDSLRILVGDDHPIVRFGLRMLLNAHQGWVVCGEASDGREAIEMYKQLKPDVVSLDICMPKLNGAEAARQILKLDPTQRIMILTDVESEKMICQCLAMGVRGWVLKSDGPNDLIAAVEALRCNRTFFTAVVADLVSDGCLSTWQYKHKQYKHNENGTMKARLTPREQEVVQMIGEGGTTQDVATVLGISVKTAETHRNNIMRKLGFHTAAGLVLYAVRNDIVHLARPVSLRQDRIFRPMRATQVQSAAND
jgi:DNA-binding NarL/FixJ family response regulator